MDSLIITGFMGTGKSTVAKQVAARLGWGFIDLDEVLETRFGCSIAVMFETVGEAVFRSREQALLEEVLSRPGLVIATGGGTLVQPGAMEKARAGGKVVCLTASLQSILARIGSGTERPLASGGAERLAALLASRAEHYAQAHLQVDTDAQLPDGVASEICAWFLEQSGVEKLRRVLEQDPALPTDTTLEVPLGDRRYTLEFNAGGRHQLGAQMRRQFPMARRTVVITNARVGALYGDDVLTSLKEAGFSPLLLEVPDSEDAKQLSEVARLLDALIGYRLERREPLVALGGGVVGDLVGFVASIYLRGVPFVQVPTTLLSQVDSSVGGKTGVNSPRGKNLIGSFYQPAHVLIDVEVLKTLDDADFRAGMAEVIKYGAIRDLPFFEFLEANVEAIRANDVTLLERLIHRSCANKAWVVVKDERELGERALLNFGHTLGHVFETLGAYHGLKHGLAVAIGMAFAARLSVERGMLLERAADRLISLMIRYGLPVIPPQATVAECLEVMTLDKKVSQGAVKFIVLEALGRARIEPLSFDAIASSLKGFLEVRA